MKIHSWQMVANMSKEEQNESFISLLNDVALVSLEIVILDKTQSQICDWDLLQIIVCMDNLVANE